MNIGYRQGCGRIHGSNAEYYNYFRDYDPRIGRYLQSDPIGLNDGTGTYGYVDSSPLANTDHLGLFLTPEVIAAVDRNIGQSLPPAAFDFATGVADAASLGIGPEIRNALGIGSIDRCSAAYSMGEFASLVFGIGRVAYAAAARALPKAVAQQPERIDFARSVSEARDTLKRAFRLGSFPSYRIRTWEQTLKKYGSEPEQIIEAATRTSPRYNAAGATLAAGSIINRSTCECGGRR